MKKLVKGALVVLLFQGLFGLAQVTIQYDTGDTTNSPQIPAGGSFGNLFSGLGASMTITRVTFYVVNNPGPNIIRFRETANDAADDFITLFNSGGTVDGLKTHTLMTPFQFVGTDVHVGFQSYYSNAIPLDTMTGGLGFHAWRAVTAGMAVTFGGNPANYIIRISGPAGLPVELETFSIE